MRVRTGWRDAHDALIRAAWLLAFAATGAVRGFGQGVPPAHLPRMLEECDLVQSAVACGIWTWQGSFYRVMLNNGAIAQVTVGGSASNLQLQRTDTGGPLAGLMATYTGH